MGLFSRIRKSIKRATNKVSKGIKSTAKKTVKGLKKAGFNSRFGTDFAKGFAMTGRALQQPEKFITKNDPLAKKMGGAGFLSPISLAGSIVTAPLTSIGVFEELAADKKKQKKLRSGDADTITDVALAPLGLIPVGGGVGGVGKAGGRTFGKSIARSVGRAFGGLF